MIDAATRPPEVSGPRHEALQDALALGASITHDSVGSSVTELTGEGFNTPAASNQLAMALDHAQYQADDGPCVAACRDGRSHSITVIQEEAAYAGFIAAAVAHNVRSSLSLPLPGADRPSALNLYASSTSAFESGHARAVAQLLSRCVTALLPLAGVLVSRPRSDVELNTVQADNLLVARAMRVLEVRDGLSRSAAFTHLTMLSRTEQRRVVAIARDIVDNTEEPRP